MSDFRDYNVLSERKNTIDNTYRQNHVEMTVDKVIRLRKEWLHFKKGSYTIKEVIDMLDTFVDDSDPDIELPNNIHAFQTAEFARKEYPDLDWLHLVGLLNDLGKIMSVWGLPQHLVVGDTFVVGCEHPKEIIYHNYFSLNIDSYDSRYNTKNGMYMPKCGLENLILSWGHDEYMYWILSNNGCTIPQHGLDIIRYHSFYAWHSGGAYRHLTTEYDNEVTLPWIIEFNKFDLYSKADDENISCRDLWDNYYSKLCAKYKIDGKLNW